MKPNAVAKSYDQLAERWAGDEFDQQNGIAQHQRALAFARKQGSALDLGCGSSGRILELLVQHGFEAEGLDISTRMIELAKSHHPQLTFYHADICSWAVPKTYDFISAWDSIWHIPLAEQKRVMNNVLAALNPGGVCIFTLGGTDQPDERSDAAMGPPMYHSTPGIPRALRIVADADCICRHLEYDHYPDMHAYIIVQKLATTN